MFAGVINKDENKPWGELEMSTAIWKNIRIWDVQIKDLVATQSGVYFKDLISDAPSISGDEFPHVILFEDTYYLEDGHHRVVKAALSGREVIQARVLRL